jgi:hypothetical protein
VIFKRLQVLDNLHTDQCTVPAGNYKIGRLSDVDLIGYFTGLLRFSQNTGIPCRYPIKRLFELFTKCRVSRPAKPLRIGSESFLKIDNYTQIILKSYLYSIEFN